MEGRAAVLGGFLGDSAAIGRLRARAFEVALEHWPLLLWGEPGTGKRLLARLLHRAGRPERPWVALAGASLHRESLPSVFARAGDGTLFLDDIEEASDAAQKTLAEALRERCAGAEPLGARVVATCAADPVALCERGLLDLPLFEAVAAVALPIPPLRERGEDRRILAAHFLRLHREVGYGDVRFGDEALALIDTLPFPGNVAELECLVVRAAVLRRTGEITGADLRAAMDLGGEPSLRRGRAEALRSFHRAYVQSLLADPRSAPPGLPPYLRRFIHLWQEGVRALADERDAGS